MLELLFQLSKLMHANQHLLHHQIAPSEYCSDVLPASQALQLGQWLAQRYRQQMSLLPADYDAQAVRSRTTNYRRTRATLAAVLKGLFPGQVGPFVAHTGGAHNDILLPQVNRCPQLAALFLAVKAAVKHKARCSALASCRLSCEHETACANLYAPAASAKHRRFALVLSACECDMHVTASGRQRT